MNSAKYKRVKISEIADYVFRGITPKYVEDNGVVVINQRCIRDGRILVENAKVTDITRKVSTEKYLQCGDILINSTGVGTVGRVALVKSMHRQTTVDGHVTIVRINKTVADPMYVYYCLYRRQGDIALLAKGSTGQVELSRAAISDISIDLPDLDTQKKIADILNAFDDKIELNRQMNETLEEMGRALFRHYFIDNSEAKNWPKRRLGEFFDVVTGKKDANYATSDGKYPFFTCAQTISRAPTYSFDGDAILLAGNGDFNVKIYSGKFEAYQRTYVLIPYKSKLIGFLYYLMNVQLQDITGGSQGSVIRFITKGMIDGYSFALPDDDRLLALSGVFNNIVELSEYNNNENFVLVNIRDSIARKLVGR